MRTPVRFAFVSALIVGGVAGCQYDYEALMGAGDGGSQAARTPTRGRPASLETPARPAVTAAAAGRESLQERVAPAPRAAAPRARRAQGARREAAALAAAPAVRAAPARAGAPDQRAAPVRAAGAASGVRAAAALARVAGAGSGGVERSRSGRLGRAVRAAAPGPRAVAARAALALRRSHGWRRSRRQRRGRPVVVPPVRADAPTPIWSSGTSSTTAAAPSPRIRRRRPARRATACWRRSAPAAPSPSRPTIKWGRTRSA